MKFHRRIALRFSNLSAAVLLIGGLCLASNASAETSSSQVSADSSLHEVKLDHSANSRVVAKASAPGDVVKSKATWYGPGLHGKKTATGERFNSNAMTAASNRLPLGSEVVVTNLENGKSAKVRINDCGPRRHGSKIDVSKKAAHRLGMTHDGTAPVKAEVVSMPSDAETCDGVRASR